MTHEYDYDLIVVGAGPAGCAAAITAARVGATVLLLERGRYPRHKVCGEFVSAESLTLLESLLGDQEMLAAAPRIHRARLYAASTTINIDVNPSAIALTRFDLDAALYRAAELAGVTALQQTAVTSLQREGQRFLASTSAGYFTSPTAIVAAGRWFALDARNSLPADGPKSIGIKAHFRDPDQAVSSSTVELHFFSGGYCGLQSVGNGIFSACAMVRADIATTLSEVLAQSATLSSRAQHWQPTFEPVTTYPLLFRPPRPDTDGVLYAGDSATFVDPFIGDGISLALNTGTAAARALAPVWCNRSDLAAACLNYRSEYESRFLRVFRNAALIRSLLSLPPVLQTTAAQLMRIPAVSRKFLRLTRAA